MKKISRPELACTLTLSGVLVATVVHIILITLNLFGVTNFNVPANFNYIFAYILTIVCLALYFFGFFVAKFKKVIFPAWLRILFYIAFLINVLSVSIFYNAQKDDKNRLKSSNKFIVLSVFCYSVAFSTFAEFIISAVKVIFFKSAATTTLLAYVISVSSMLVVNIALAVAFLISLKKTKKFINACLVKYTVKVLVKKSVKEEQ